MEYGNNTRDFRKILTSRNAQRGRGSESSDVQQVQPSLGS